MSGRAALAGYLTADVLATAGVRVSMIAVPWFVLTTTGSAALTGVVAFAGTVPQVLAQALSGPLVDRLGARRVAVGAEALSVPVLAAVPVAHALDVLSIPLLCLLVAVAGALNGPADGARGALTPQVARHAGTTLERVAGLSGTAERTAGLVGAALGGVLVAAVGAPSALLVTAVGWGAAALLTVLATRRLVPPEPAPRQGYLVELREGAGFLRRDPVLLGIAAMVAVTNLLDQAYSAVLLPTWVVTSGLGATVLGLLGASFSGSAIAGSLLAAAYGDRLPRFTVYVVAFLLAGAPRFVVLALDAPLAGVVATGVVGGFAAGFINPLVGALMFGRTPEPMVGRVGSMLTASAWSLMPFGGLLAGGLVAGVGLAPALLVCGTAYLVATMAPAAGPRFRAMDRPPHPRGAVSDATAVPRRAA
ncbi:MFS transporter [Nocardioides sp. CFH 31398]|uniref:MFS transporter n=1 Tax=Nocardioides sp. CFH 31398 TaxID=2919579 RepID=UPI001F0634A4|nr:MFS transporter [Nocardioides sp. CFH 31398]MCH1864905.1 MFS transporter [Nocardioides sp. CFH 31398]